MSETNLMARFMAKVSPEPTSGCWLWAGALFANGYARIYGEGGRKAKLLYGHRVGGSIPPGLQLDHLCRVRSCVNPEHLEAVTSKMNVLRGEGLSAKNLRKNVCKRGHPYNKTRTRIDGRPYRYCSVCQIDLQRIARKEARRA